VVADLGIYAKQSSHKSYANPDMGVSSEHAFSIAAQSKTSPPKAPGKPVVLSCTPQPSNFRARATQGSIVPGGARGEGGGVGGGSSSSCSGGSVEGEGWMAKDDGQGFMPIAMKSARRTSVSLRVPSAGAMKEIQFLVHNAHHGGPAILVSRTRDGEVDADAEIFGAPANVAVAHLAQSFRNRQAFQGGAAREVIKWGEERRNKRAERESSSAWQHSRRTMSVSISSSDSSDAASSTSLASSLECDSHLASGSEPEQLSRLSLQDPCASTQLVSELNQNSKAPR
jgi:hypothetical protein